MLREKVTNRYRVIVTVKNAYMIVFVANSLVSDMVKSSPLVDTHVKKLSPKMICDPKTIDKTSDILNDTMIETGKSLSVTIAKRLNLSFSLFS